jgi:tight adherence protein C
MLAIAATNVARARAEVRRRASESVATAAGNATEAVNRDSGGLGRFAFDGAILDLARKFVDGETDQSKVLKAKLAQAGYLAPTAFFWFFAFRFILALPLALLTMIVAPLVVEELPLKWLAISVLAAAVIGYIAPSLYLDRRVAARVQEIRTGFPDFMDLMVVCSEAGLSMEASLERVSRELAAAYPSLAENLTITTLEIRAGRTVSESLDRLAKRSGVDEAKSFATLLQQSEELGSSVTQSLKVYSDDMRNKRMMKAEEKAYALPAKLVVPLTMFVFPVLLITLLLPVVIRMMGVE